MTGTRGQARAITSEGSAGNGTTVKANPWQSTQSNDTGALSVHPSGHTKRSARVNTDSTSASVRMRARATPRGLYDFVGSTLAGNEPCR